MQGPRPRRFLAVLAILAAGAIRSAGADDALDAADLGRVGPAAQETEPGMLPASALFGSRDEAAPFGGGAEEAPAPTAPAAAAAPVTTAPTAEAPKEAPKAPELKTPLLKKLFDKGILTADEAMQIEKEEKKGSFIDSLAERIKFSGETYFGYTYKVPAYHTSPPQSSASDSASGDFELRRNYITITAMLTKNISFRNTLDIVKEAGGGNIEVRIKYAYLYFDNILPKTGLELGVAHRTWIDYEDTHGWFYRAIEKGFVEASDGANLFGSADLGANLRTFFPHFSSEVGIFNGENYDHLDYSGGKFFANSIEGRATWHILGKGDKKVDPLKDQYFDVSLNTVNNFRMNAGSTSTTVPGSSGYPAGTPKAGDLDRLVYQAHTVYNRPEFLVAGSLVYNQDRFDHIYGNLDNKGFSVNGEIRPFMFFPETFPTQKDAWAAFGRMDYWDIDNSGDRRLWLYGVAYRLNRYVRFILNGETADYSEDTTKTKSYSKAMFTVHVVW